MHEIIVPAKIDYLQKIILFVRSSMKEFEIEETPENILLAVEEVFTNIVNYANVPKKEQVTFQIQALEEPCCYEFRFIDRGIPFNPLEREDPNLDLPIEERNIGGLGIYLVKKLMDEANYEYRNGNNIFSFIKKIESDLS